MSADRRNTQKVPVKEVLPEKKESNTGGPPSDQVCNFSNNINWLLILTKGHNYTLYVQIMLGAVSQCKIRNLAFFSGLSPVFRQV